MSDPGVTIILPQDAPADLLARIRAVFPEARIALPEPDATTAPLADTAALIERAVLAAPGLPGSLADWWAGLGGGPWPVVALAIVLAAGLAGQTASRLLIPAATGHDGDTGAAFTLRATRAVRWLLAALLRVAVFHAGAAIAIAVVAGGNAALSEGLRALLGVVAFLQVLLAVFDALSAPGAPGRRAMGFRGDEARRAWRACVEGLSVLALLLAARVIVQQATDGTDTGNLARVLLVLLAVPPFAWLFLGANRPLRAVLERSMAGRDDIPPWQRLIARNPGYLYIGLVAIDAGVKTAGILGLLGAGFASGTGPTIAILVLAPLAVAGLRVWQSERGEAAPDSAPSRREPRRAGLFALAEGVVIVVMAVALMRAWGLDPLAAPAASGIGLVLPRLVEAAIILTIGIALWRVATAMMAGPEPVEPGGAHDDGPAQGRSRMETILPILRYFVLAVIGTLTALLALSALGLDIAPLLAGAGVFGLAIGFGAQRLVADIISGLFYLYEDAFRIGEYIQASSGKGTVERMLLRSVVLRHHNGPVFTIPFSDLGTVENLSRDWVKMKFTFSVPSDTDLESVRKAVKTVGQELEADPELAGKFLEPLKSQGAIAINGPSYEIGCKYSTRPGDQFAVRRKVYVALQRALKEKGIAFFAPQLKLAPGEAPPGAPQLTV